MDNWYMINVFTIRNQFKLERWMDYGKEAGSSGLTSSLFTSYIFIYYINLVYYLGPTIAAAFASPNEGELRNLRVLLTEMMKRSPQDAGLVTQPSSNAFTMLNSQQTFGSNNIQAGPYADRNHSSALSVDARSFKSTRSYGVMSTGPVERVSDPTGSYRY